MGCPFAAARPAIPPAVRPHPAFASPKVSLHIFAPHGLSALMRRKVGGQREITDHAPSVACGSTGQRTRRQGPRRGNAYGMQTPQNASPPAGHAARVQRLRPPRERRHGRTAGRTAGPGPGSDGRWPVAPPPLQPTTDLLEHATGTLRPPDAHGNAHPLRNIHWESRHFLNLLAPKRRNIACQSSLSLHRRSRMSRV